MRLPLIRVCQIMRVPRIVLQRTCCLQDRTSTSTLSIILLASGAEGPLSPWSLAISAICTLHARLDPHLYHDSASVGTSAPSPPVTCIFHILGGSSLTCRSSMHLCVTNRASAHDRQVNSRLKKLRRHFSCMVLLVLPPLSCATPCKSAIYTSHYFGGRAQK